MDKGIIIHTLIVNNKKQFLILKRSTHKNVLAGSWDLPGGSLEDGEDPGRGAVREVKEETGLDIAMPHLFFYKANIDKRKNKQFVTLIFISHYKGKNIVKVNPKEHSEYKWIKTSEMPKYKVVDYLTACVKFWNKKEHEILKTIHK